MAGGAIYTVANLDQPDPDPTAGIDEFRRQAEANARARTAAITTGIALGAGGLVIGLIGMSLTPPTPSPPGPRITFGLAPTAGGAFAALAVAF